MVIDDWHYKTYRARYPEITALCLEVSYERGGGPPTTPTIQGISANVEQVLRDTLPELEGDRRRVARLEWLSFVVNRTLSTSYHLRQGEARAIYVWLKGKDLEQPTNEDPDPQTRIKRREELAKWFLDHSKEICRESHRQSTRTA
jgi:hypothetical protein